MGPFEFDDHKFTGGQTAIIQDNHKQTCLFRSSVARSFL